MDNEDAPILLVEDDEVDVMMVQRALRRYGFDNPLHVAESGDKALELLRGEFGPPVRPELILLDLNMPRMDGLTFLRLLRQERRFQPLPVVVLTSSNQPRDREEAFRYNVAGYFVKPVVYEELLETVGVIGRYWQLSKRP